MTCADQVTVTLEPPLVEHVTITLTEPEIRVITLTEGTPGAKGDKGDKGDPGDPAAFDVDQVADRYVQATPASTWTINHMLAFKPAVTVVDSSGSWVIGEVQYTSPSQIVLHFSGAFSGEAYLS
jgi:hypothetical protein